MSHLIPDEQISQAILNRGAFNIMAKFLEAIQEEAIQAANEWGEETKHTPNIFMEDSAKSAILSTVIGYFTVAQPTRDQLSEEHLTAYFAVPAAPTPPAPDPVED